MWVVLRLTLIGVVKLVILLLLGRRHHRLLLLLVLRRVSLHWLTAELVRVIELILLKVHLLAALENIDIIRITDNTCDEVHAVFPDARPPPFSTQGRECQKISKYLHVFCESVSKFVMRHDHDSM